MNAITQLRLHGAGRFADVGPTRVLRKHQKPDVVRDASTG
jgi:hypothetical protein